MWIEQLDVNTTGEMVRAGQPLARIFSQELIANDSSYGLSGSIWTAEPGTAFAMAQSLQTGNVGINGGTGGMSPWAPFGGYKRSGVGRELGADVLDDFTETKAIQFHAG